MGPNKTILENQLGDIKIFAADGKGACFRKDGTFRGFIECSIFALLKKRGLY